MDIRPAHTSWSDVEGDRRLDLLIWKPALDDFVTSDSLSSGDGSVHTLEPPLTKQQQELIQ